MTGGFCYISQLQKPEHKKTTSRKNGWWFYLLKVDPEFQGKIPPLTFEELNQLEANILRDGRIINPIIVWEGLIVDGHNRFIIAKKHPEIPFTVHETEFANRYEAII